MPKVIAKRQRACVAVSAPSGGEGSWARPEPVVSGKGPIDRDTIGRYQTIAVMLFDDAASVSGSGSQMADIVTTLMLDLDAWMVE